MRVIGTVGLPGSGKGEAAKVASSLNIPVVTMGDVVRAETESRGLDPYTDHGSVAKALREEEGPAAIAARSLPMVESSLESHDRVLVDGLRSGTEVEAFEERFGDEFVLLSVEAPFELRAERLSGRGRDTTEADGGEALRERDERERGFGMDEAMDRADLRIENTTSLEAFREAIRTLLTEGPEAVEDMAVAEGER
ncbi:AAA family ATPase [Natronorarus salvus]|uniref:AAA family ATPase n=1 Tax=Natronorarus salvus TaxID=3117733 RepID=UPI002F266CA9